MARAFKWLSIVAASGVTLVVIAILTLYWLSPDSSFDEVARILSPQGEFEAVLMETNGGATTSFGYEVFVVPRGIKSGTRAALLYGSVRNVNAYGANLRWVSASTLRVEFEQAKSAQLEHPTVTVSGRTVNVELRPGVTDPTAPSGGMLYNLQGRQ